MSEANTHVPHHTQRGTFDSTDGGKPPLVVLNIIFRLCVVWHPNISRNSDRGAGDRRAPSGEKGGDVGYARLEERMARRLSGIQESRNPWIQEFRNSGIQESRNLGIQEFRNSGDQASTIFFSSFAKMCLWNETKILKKSLEKHPKSSKNPLTSIKKASKMRSWSHFGFQGDARQKKHGSLTILTDSQGSPRVSKIEPKPRKKLTKNQVIFYQYFETILNRFGCDFYSKWALKMRGVRVVCLTSCEHAKSVILNNPLSVLLYFSFSNAFIFDIKW